PALVRFKARRCATVEQVKDWVEEERRRARTGTDEHGRTPTKSSVAASVRVSGSPFGRVPSSAQLVANGAGSLLNVCCYLLDRQIAVWKKPLSRRVALRSASTACAARGGTVANSVSQSWSMCRSNGWEDWRTRYSVAQGCLTSPSPARRR